MANINNKLFAYTYAKINDAELLKQYENSLIFIGEEQQIYQPLTNTYIGIGKSAFTELENQINDVTGNKISEVVSYLNKTNTGKISAQYSEGQFKKLYGLGTGPLGTYNSNDYYADDIYTTSNNVILRGANQFTGINDGTISGLQNVFANSGINVSINRGEAHRNEYNPLDGSYNVTYYETSYITIDDTYTWSYIGSVNTYITDYAQKVAVEQANRVYKNLLGINDNVYIEKGFNEAGARISSEGVDDTAEEFFKIENVAPNNFFTAKYRESRKDYTDIVRKSYIITKVNELGNGVSVYVDVTTGLIIGGEAFGD